MADQMEMDGIGKADVIYNFVPDEYSGEREIDDSLALTYVGIMEPHKGPQTLLEAFARSKDHHGFALNMIGDGSLRPSIAERVRKLGLEDRVHVRGYVQREELNQLLAGSVAQIIPSQWYENNPLTAIEAFSQAIPVLGSRIGGLPEILNEESGSRTFEAEDIRDLSDKLIQLWTEKDKLNQMSKQARNAYLDKFTPERHINRYLQILNS
jgi:glycosyltransferase involved in cell wall biosynthesis